MEDAWAASDVVIADAPKSDALEKRYDRIIAHSSELSGGKMSSSSSLPYFSN